MGFFKTCSYKRGATLAIGATFIWKFFSFINSILIAFYFGTQTKSDIYFYIITISGVFSLLFTSLNRNVLIPQAIFLRKKQEGSEQPFINFWLALYSLILILILILGFIYPVNIFSVISKFSPLALNQDPLILQLAFLYTNIFILYYFILDVMYLYHIFSVNFLAPLNAIAPMFIMILFHNTVGIKTMLIGFTFSYFIQVIIYLFIMKSKLNWSFTTFKIEFPKRLKNNIVTNQILVFTKSLTYMIPVYLMSNFSAGIVSALSYAKQLTDTPTEILTFKLIDIYQIQLNENAASKDIKALNTNYLKLNYLLLFIMIPFALFICYFAQDIISLFFKRGKFNLDSVSNVVGFLRPMMIALITGILAPFAPTLIASTRKIKESFKYILSKDIILILAMYISITHWGPYAYPYTLIICSILDYLITSLFFKKYLSEINFWHSLKEATLLVSLNLIALIPAVFINITLKGQNNLVRIFICGIIFLFILTLLYLPTKQLKKILSFVLGARYNTFLTKIPSKLKPFFI